MISILAPGDSAEERAQSVGRARRNLLLTTVALFFAETYGITVQSGQLFGVTVGFGDAIDLATPLWIVAFYFLLRFIQSLQQFLDLGVHKAYQQRFSGVEALKVARNKAAKTLNGDEFFHGTQYERYEYSADGTVQTVPKGLEVKLSVVGKGPGETIGASGTTILVAPKELRWAQLRAWLYVFFATPLGTELFLPPVLLLVVVLVKVCGGFGLK